MAETIAGGMYLNEHGELVDAFGRSFVGPQDVHELQRAAVGQHASLEALTPKQRIAHAQSQSNRPPLSETIGWRRSGRIR